MRKNKLMWNIALFLIAIVSIPIAYAQTFTGSSWFFIIINSLIVGVVLFILQSFLMQGKNDKEKTAVWVAIIAGSLLVGFLFGSQGFIWQHPVFAKFFSIYVLVNAVVIGIVLYFLSGFLDINKKLGSPEGKGSLGIIIFLIAALFAVQIGNQWIWQKAVVRQFIDYLFGSQGILNPAPPEYRLWAFITVATLLSFFFNGFLLRGGAGGTNKVNYALAILIGSSVARAGISFASIVLLGEAIFTIVLAEALKGTAPDVKGKSTNWILAAFLVGWASAAMTYGTEYQGWLAWIVGTPLWAMGLIQVGPTGAAAQPTGTRWFGWIAKMGGGALVLAIIALVFLFVIGRGNRGMIKEGAKRAFKNLLDQLRKRTRLGKFLTDTAAIKNPVLDGELPLELKDMRYETFLLWNFILRHEIFKFKTGSTKELMEQAKAMETILGNRIPEHDDIYRNMKSLIEGGDQIKTFGEIVYKDGVWQQEGGRVGWARSYVSILDAMDQLRVLLNNNLTAAPFGQELDRDLPASYMRRLDLLTNSVNVAYRRYSAGVRRYKAVNKFRALRLKFLDMYNLYGKYNRGYSFAKWNAKLDYYTWPIKKDSDNKLLRKIDWSKVEKVGSETRDVKNYDDPSQKYLLELNTFGFCISDINAIEVERKEPQYKYLRRFKIEDRVYLPKPVKDWAVEEDSDLSDEQKKEINKEAESNVVLSKVFAFSLQDWEYFLRDMFRGSFHPFSRSITDYGHLLKDVKIDFRNVSFSGLLDEKDVAFDREALKHPGMWVYWGRKNYYDENPDSLKRYPVNPYPMASIAGLWAFINGYSTRLAGNVHETESWIETYARMQYADLGKPIEVGGEKKNG